MGVVVTERIVERQPEVSLHELQVAWLRIMKRVRLTRHHTVRRDELSVREHMSMVLRRLEGGAFVVFDSLFDLKLGAAGVVVCFLAVLELVKERMINLAQTDAFAPIYVRLADASEHA